MTDLPDVNKLAYVGTEHPHEPEIPPALDPDGRCLVCKLVAERDRLREANTRLQRFRDTTVLHGAREAMDEEEAEEAALASEGEQAGKGETR